MFAAAAITVERWGMEGFGGMWVPRPPEAWPVPTVVEGELWEQKSELMPTWEASAALPPSSPYRGGTHRVVLVAGECFLNERGYPIPWAPIPGPHWRLLQVADDAPLPPPSTPCL